MSIIMYMNIRKLADSEKKEMIRLLSKLIAEDTTNPPGNEWRAAEVVKKFFRKEKIAYRVFEKEKGRTNVIGYIGKGKPELMVACHLDTVPAGSGWRTNPFRAKVSKGKVYGRGATDNKGPMAAMLIMGKIMKKFESKLRGKIILACVADEEVGSKYGMKYILDKKHVKPDFAVIPDVERKMREIYVAEKGLLFLKITSLGKQAHGSHPEKGVNAIWNMIEFLNLFKKYKMKYKNEPIFKEPPGSTRNLGMISGGISTNAVPARCEAKIDMRYLPSQNAQELIKDVKKMIASVRRRNRHAEFLVEIIDSQKPVKVDEKNMLVRVIKKNAKSILGKEPGIYGMSGTTVSKPLVGKGVVSVGFGPGDHVAHIANEYIRLKELTDFTKILCLVCLDMLT